MLSRYRITIRMFIPGWGLALAVLLFSCHSPTRNSESGPPAVFGGKTQCWVLIDFDSMFCSPCLAPLLEFCRSLPRPIREESVRGILIYGRRTPEGASGAYDRVVRKKMQGFVKANDLGFKVFLDERHLFNGLVGSNAEVLVFDDKQQIVHKYVLPLRPQERNELLEFFASGAGHKNRI